MSELDQVRAERDYWMRRATTAEEQRDAWDENHQILTEHFQRMTKRAENADAAREEATRIMIRATSRAKRAENRAAAWWEAAKTLCRQRYVCNNAASEGWHRAYEYRERAENAEHEGWKY